jgi:DNA-binding IclR family transcriptional regulator
VQSAGTAAAVLKGLAELGGAASLSALAAELDASPAKLHRYLVSLVESGFVLQDAATSRYALGPEAIAVGLAAIRQSDALTLGGAELARLAEEDRLSGLLAVLGNRGPTIVRWDEPPEPVSVNVRVGSVLPVLWSATGRAFGAFSASAAVAQSVRRELASAPAERRRELPDAAAVERLFARIRGDGCAPVRDVLLTGVSAVAAPIFDAAGRLAAVLTALGTSGSFDPTPGGPVARRVVRAAADVSRRLGHAVR